MFLQVVGDVEARSEKEKHEAFQAAIKYKADRAVEIARALAAGEPRPQFIPDPDDIALNNSTYEVFFHGPICPDEKEEWDQLWAAKDACYAKYLQLKQQVEGLEPSIDRAPLELEMKICEYILLGRSLYIMRRWRLPAERIVDDHRLQNSLTLHVLEGTDPEYPGYRLLSCCKARRSISILINWLSNRAQSSDLHASHQLVERLHRQECLDPWVKGYGPPMLTEQNGPFKCF